LSRCAVFRCQSSGVVRFLVLEKCEMQEKKEKMTKKEVFELEMISIWMKKWTSWRCSIILSHDDVL
jgi:hypothetical protein